VERQEWCILESYISSKTLVDLMTLTGLETLIDFVWAVLIAIAAWIAQISLKKFQRWRTFKKPVRKIMGILAKDSQQIKVFVGTFPIPRYAAIKDKITEQEVMSLVNIPEITSIISAKCLSFIFAFLMSARSVENIDIISSNDYRESDLSSNIICIGGPITNKVTRSIFELENIWLPYEFIGERIRKKEGNGEWTITNEIDHGVIIKTRNPFSAEKWIFIFAGLSGDASIGASYYFQCKFRDLADQSGNGPFGAIVEVNRKAGYLSARKIDHIEQEL
jgi:hypothetical protein